VKQFSQQIIVGEIDSEFTNVVGAEGATAPETLRQKDRDAMGLWKAGAQLSCVAPPKMKAAPSVSGF
jgi:hypothetical protein